MYTVICQYRTILYKGLGHLQMVVSEEGPGTSFQWAVTVYANTSSTMSTIFKGVTNANVNFPKGQG